MPPRPTWTPTVSASNEGFSMGWIALGALGGAALVVLALWQLGSLPFARGGERPGAGGQRRASASS